MADAMPMTRDAHCDARAPVDVLRRGGAGAAMTPWPDVPPLTGLRLCPAALASQASLAPHALRIRCEFGIPVVKVVRCEVGLKALYS